MVQLFKYFANADALLNAVISLVDRVPVQLRAPWRLGCSTLQVPHLSLIASRGQTNAYPPRSSVPS